MPTPNGTTITPLSANIELAPTFYIGPNTYVQNDSAHGLTTTLPITTENVLTSKGGLNINSVDSDSNLTIDSYGNVNTQGYISSMGDIYTQGKLNASGELNALNLNIGTDNNKFTVSQTGAITAQDDLTIGANKIILRNSNGQIDMIGDLNINTNKFNVTSSNGNVSAAGTLTIAGDTNIGDGKVTINASTGEIDATGDVNVNAGQIILGSADGSIKAQGDLSIGSDFINPTFKVFTTDGHAESLFPVNNYVESSAATDTTTYVDENNETIGTGLFNSTTNRYLTTQEYVDKAIFKQTVRINTILGSDPDVLNSFKNVYNVVKAIEGSTTAHETLTTVANNMDAVTTTITELAGNASNTVLINCSRAVWVDECAPLPIPYSLTQQTTNFSLDGWYFKNLVANSKVNWYIPANNGMTMNDFVNIYMNVFVVNKNSLPFITIYTKAKHNSTDLWPGIANARINYMFSSVQTPTVNKMYNMYIGDNRNTPENNSSFTAIKCGQTITANSTNYNNGFYGSVRNSNTFDSSYVSLSDEILTFCVQSASTASVNDAEFVLTSFNVQQNSLNGEKGTTQFLFQNSSVASNYMFNTFFKKNSDFSAISNKNAALLTAYNGINNAN